MRRWISRIDCRSPKQVLPYLEARKAPNIPVQNVTATLLYGLDMEGDPSNHQSPSNVYQLMPAIHLWIWWPKITTNRGTVGNYTRETNNIT